MPRFFFYYSFIFSHFDHFSCYTLYNGSVVEIWFRLKQLFIVHWSELREHTCTVQGHTCSTLLNMYPYMYMYREFSNSFVKRSTVLVCWTMNSITIICSIHAFYSACGYSTVKYLLSVLVSDIHTRFPINFYRNLYTQYCTCTSHTCTTCRLPYIAIVHLSTC